jgi:hypothetical protein
MPAHIPNPQLSHTLQYVHDTEIMWWNYSYTRFLLRSSHLHHSGNSSMFTFLHSLHAPPLSH